MTTNSGKAPDIQSILSSKKPKFKTVEKIGINFKISRNPFAEGGCRIAYRGRFDPEIQEEDWFQSNSNVVVKDIKEIETSGSFEDCLTYLELREYANELSKTFNKIRS